MSVSRPDTLGVPVARLRRRRRLRPAGREVDRRRPALRPGVEVASLVGRQLAAAERGEPPSLLLVEGEVADADLDQPAARAQSRDRQSTVGAAGDTRP